MVLKWNLCPNNRLTKDTSWRQQSSHRASPRLHRFKSRTTQSERTLTVGTTFTPYERRKMHNSAIRTKVLFLNNETVFCFRSTLLFCLSLWSRALYCACSLFHILDYRKVRMVVTVVGFSEGVGWDVISALKTKHKVLAIVTMKLTINEVWCWVLIIKPRRFTNFSDLFLE